jgi:hypothetical protein
MRNEELKMKGCRNGLRPFFRLATSTAAHSANRRENPLPYQQSDKKKKGKHVTARM